MWCTRTWRDSCTWYDMHHLRVCHVWQASTWRICTWHDTRPDVCICNLYIYLAPCIAEADIWMSRVTDMNVYFFGATHRRGRENKSVIHVWMSHVIYMFESCHTYEWATQMNESWYPWTFTSLAPQTEGDSRNRKNRSVKHVWMSHVTRMNESCHTHVWVMSNI